MRCICVPTEALAFRDQYMLQLCIFILYHDLHTGGEDFDKHFGYFNVPLCTTFCKHEMKILKETIL